MMCSRARLETRAREMGAGYLEEALALVKHEANGFLFWSEEDGQRLREKYGKLKPRGLGDMVAAIAQPIARAIDAVAGTNIKRCGGCRKRREILNQIGAKVGI